MSARKKKNNQKRKLMKAESRAATTLAKDVVAEVTKLMPKQPRRRAQTQDELKFVKSRVVDKLKEFEVVDEYLETLVAPAGNPGRRIPDECITPSGTIQLVKATDLVFDDDGNFCVHVQPGFYNCLGMVSDDPLTARAAGQPFELRDGQTLSQYEDQPFCDRINIGGGQTDSGVVYDIPLHPFYRNYANGDGDLQTKVVPVQGTSTAPYIPIVAGTANRVHMFFETSEEIGTAGDIQGHVVADVSGLISVSGPAAAGPSAIELSFTLGATDTQILGFQFNTAAPLSIKRIQVQVDAGGGGSIAKENCIKYFNVPEIEEYDQTIIAYRIVSAMLLVSWRSGLLDNGRIAAKNIPGNVDCLLARTGYQRYDTLSSIAGAYDGPCNEGVHCLWFPQQRSDLAWRRLAGTMPRNDLPSIMVSGSVVNVDARNMRVVLVQNLELTSTKQTFVISRPPVEPDSIGRAFQLMNVFPPITGNPIHMKDVDEFLVKARKKLQAGIKSAVPFAQLLAGLTRTAMPGLSGLAAAVPSLAAL